MIDKLLQWLLPVFIALDNKQDKPIEKDKLK